jgi:hypothetical protein
MVVHRAAPVTAAAERITMVNGYTSTDASLDDQSRPADLISVDDHGCLWTEWAKYAAWRSQSRLSDLVSRLEFNPDRDAVVGELEAAIADVRKAIDEMKGGERPMAHYGG